MGLLEATYENLGQVVGVGAADSDVALREDRTACRPGVLQSGRSHDAVRCASLAQLRLSHHLLVEDGARVEPDDRDVGGADELLLLLLAPLWPGHARARTQHNLGRNATGLAIVEGLGKLGHTVDVDERTIRLEARCAPNDGICALTHAFDRRRAVVAREVAED